jgi:hypothetical protein
MNSIELCFERDEQEEIDFDIRVSYWLEFIKDYTQAANNLTDTHPGKVHQRINRELCRAKVSLQRTLKGLPT